MTGRKRSTAQAPEAPEDTSSSAPSPSQAPTVEIIAVKGRSGIDATVVKDNAMAVWMRVAADTCGGTFIEGRHTLVLHIPLSEIGDRVTATEKVIRRCNPIGVAISPESRDRPVELMTEAVREVMKEGGRNPVGWSVVTWQLEEMYMPYDVIGLPVAPSGNVPQGGIQ